MDTVENHCLVLIYSTNIHTFLVSVGKTAYLAGNANSYYSYIHRRTQQAKCKIMRSDEKHTNKKAEMTLET